MVKFIYQNFDEIFVLNQVIFIRGIFALFFIGIFLYFKNLLNFKIIFSSRQLSIRGVFEAFAAICFFIGVATLPFGMVYVLLSLAPIFMTAFGALFLNEKVRWKRWTAVILGFIGIIIVINPKELEFGYFFIFPLLSAILLSFRDMYTKNIKGNFHSLQIAFITCLVVTIFFGFLSLYKFFNFNLKEYLILFVASFFLSLGYIFSVATIKVALVSVTSTFRYSVILWGILYGYFYFGEIPNTNTYIGAVLIVISGLIIITRQKQLGKIK
jgi:drug/metabolite transporter (DMT)-like permease